MMRPTRFGVASFALLVCGVLTFSRDVPRAGATSLDPREQGGAVQGQGQGAAGQGAAAPAQGRQGGRGGRGGGVARKRVLAWADTRNGQAQHDSVGHALAIIERLGYDSGMWDTFIRTDSNIISKTPKKTDGTPASGGPSLANVDA